MSKTLEDNKDKDKDKDKYTGLCEEEIVDGFAIFSFLTYTDLEKTVKDQEEALEDKNIVTNNNSNSKGKEIDGCNNKKTSNITGKSASSGGTVQRNRSKKNHSNNNNHKDGNNKESKKSSIVGKGLSGLTSTHHHLHHNHHNNTNHHHTKSIGKNKESKDKVNLNIHHHLNNSNNVKHNMSSSAGNKKQHVTSLTSSPGNGGNNPEVTSINGPGITGHSDDKSEPEKARKQGKERDESSCLTGSNATSTASTNVISNNTNNKDKLNLSKACHVNNINKNSVNLKHGNHSINKSKSSSTANNSNNSSTILSSTPSGKGKSSNKICHDKSSKIHDALSPVSGSSSLSSSSSSATTTTTNIVTPIGTMSSVKHSLKSSSHVDKGCKASPPSKMKKKSQSMTDENHKKKLNESIGDESESNRSIDGLKKSSKNPSSGGLIRNRGQQNNTESSKKSHKEVKSRKPSHSKDKDKSGQCKSNGHLKESKLFDQSKESQSKSYNGTTGLSTPSSSCRGRSPINTSSDEINCDTKSVTIVTKRTKKRKLKERDKSSNNIKSESSYLKDCALNSGSNGNTGNSGIANHKDKHGALTHHYSISKSSSVPSDNLNPTVVLTATTTAISLNKGKHGLKASNSHLNDKSADCQPKKIKKKSISSPKSQENQKKQSKAVLSKTTSSNTSKASPSSSSSSSSSSSLSSLSSSSLSSSSSSLSSSNSTLSGVKSTPITCTPTALSTSKVTSTANSISIQVDGDSIGCESKFINDRENKPKHHLIKESIKKEKAESLISSVSKSIKLSSSSLFSSKLSMDNTLNPCMMEISCEKGTENCEKTSSSPSTTTTTIITSTTSTVKNQPERYSQSNLSSPSATPAKRRRTSSSTNDHSKPVKSNSNQEQKLDETINTNNGKSVGKNINNNNISNNKNTVNSNNTSSYDKHIDKSVSSNRNNKVKSCDNVESKSLAIITPVTTSDSVSTESTTFSTKVLNACDSSEESQLSSVKPSKPENPCQTTDLTKSKVIATTTTTTTTTTKPSVSSSESSLETVTTNSTTMNVHCESKEDESKIDKNVNSIVIKEEMRSNQMDECDDGNINDLKKQELCSSDSTNSTAINDTKCNSIIALSSSESSNGDSVNIEKLGPSSVPVSPSLPSKPPTTESSASSSSVSNEKCVYQTSPSMSDENLSKRGLTNIASKKCDHVNNSCNINCASSNTNSNSSDNSISSISKSIDTTNVSNSISDTNSNSKDKFSNVTPLISTSVTKSSSKLSTSTPKMKPAEAAISFKLDNLLSGVPPSKSPFCVRSPNSSLMPSFTPQPSSALTNNVFSMFTPPMQMNSTSFQKPGRWNTMHVRISWEILRQQKASQGDKSNTNSSSPLTITPSSRSFNLKSPTIIPPSSSSAASASSISLPTLSKNSHLPYDLIRPPATNIFRDLRPGLQTPQSQSQQQQNQPQPHPQPQPIHHQQNQPQPSTPHSRSLEISSFSASLMNAASGGLNSTPWNHRSPFGPVSLASGHLPYPSLQAPSSSASSSSSSIPQSLACSLPSSMSTSSTYSVSTPSITAPISSLGKINGNTDILRSSNSIFGLPPRPGEMTSFSTSLYNAAVAAAGHGLSRPNLEAWNSPFAPGPGMSSIAAHNFIRSSLPGFPGFPHPHPNPHSTHNNLGLPGSVPTSMSNNLFANLAPPKTPHSSSSSISSSNLDSLMNTPGRPGSSIFPPLGREEHLPPISSSSGCGSVPGSGSSSSSSTSWGGLKAEAEKSESSKHKDGTSRNISARSKDEMRSAAHHQQHYHHHHRSSSSSNNSTSSSSNNNSKIVGSKHSSSSSNHNGDYELSHRRERDKISNSHKREHSRPSSVSSLSSGNKMMKTSSSAFNDNRSSHINESKAKDDRKESMNNYNKYFDRSHKHSSNSIDHSHRDLKSASLLSSSIGVFNNSNSAILFSTASTASFNNSIMSIPTPPGLPPSITSGNNHSSAASLASMNLHVNNAMDHRARLMGLFGLSHGPPPPPSTPSLCHSMPPSPHGLPGHLSHPNPGSGIPSGLSHDFPKSFWSPFFQPHPGFHEFPPRNDFLEREHLLQQYNILNSSGGGAPLTEKLAKEGPLHALLEKESRDKEAAFASVFDKNRLASSSVSTSTSSSTSSSVNAHHSHLRPGDTGLIAPNPPSLASPFGGPSSLVHGPGNLGLGHALPPPPLPPLSQSHPHPSSSYHHQLHQQHHLNQTSPGQSTPSSSSVLMFPPNPYLNSLHSLSASAGSNVRTDLNSRTKSLSSSASPSSAPSIKQYPHHGAAHSPSPMFIPPLNGLTGPHGFIPAPLVNSKLSTLDTSFEVNCVNRSTISMSNPSTPASGISLADLKESKSR